MEKLGLLRRNPFGNLLDLVSYTNGGRFGNSPTKKNTSKQEEVGQASWSRAAVLS